MKRNFYWLAALVLLVLGVAGVGYTQDFGDWEPPAQEQAAPQNPVQKAYADGKVVVVVTSPREYGYRLGQPMPVEVVIISQKGVVINVDAVTKGILSQTGSDFEMASAPVVTEFDQDGKHITDVKLVLRTWVTVDTYGKPKNNIVFSADFLFAVDTLPNGKPNWQTATTPDFIFSTSNTATEASKDLKPGDMEQKAYPNPTMVMPLRIAGGALLLIPLGWLVFLVYRRINPPKEVPANEKAWKVFDHVLEKSDGSGITYERTMQVASALRAYLQIDAVPQAEVAGALESFYANDSRQYELSRFAQEALAILDKALYERPEDETTAIALKPRDAQVLFERIDAIVPRP